MAYHFSKLAVGRTSLYTKMSLLPSVEVFLLPGVLVVLTAEIYSGGGRTVYRLGEQPFV